MSETDTSSPKCSCDCQTPQANESASWECICDYYKQYGQLPPCPPPPAPYPYPWPWPPPPPPPPFPPFPPPPPPPQPPKPDCDGCSDCKKEFPIISGDNCFSLDLNSFSVSEVSNANPGEYRLNKILFKKLPAGEFLKGSPSRYNPEDNGDDDPCRYSQIIPKVLDFEPRSKEAVSAFNIGVFPVTQKQFEKVTGKKHGNKGCDCGCMSEDKKDFGDPRFALPCRAKDFVSFEDAKKFIEIVNKKLAENKQPFEVALPSDNQWEYAAKCQQEATLKYYPWGEKEIVLDGEDSQAAIDHKTDDKSLRQYTRIATNLSAYATYLNGDVAQTVKLTPKRFSPVGSRKPNAWDLYDMLGCVWEWIDEPWRIKNLKEGKDDWLDADGIKANLKTVRGGGYWFNADDCRCANRHGYPPTHRDYGFGFRLVLKKKA